MKKALNLRLDEHILFTLDILAKNLNTTKTNIIENAILGFYEKTQNSRNNLIKYSGIFKDEEFTTMEKNSKDFTLELK